MLAACVGACVGGTALVRCRCNVRDRQAALDTFAAWDANADGRVDLPELVDALAASLQGEPEQAVVAKLSDMLEQRFAGRFHWDVSRSRCGARGVLPLLRVLQKDAACESLDASGCGLDNDAVIALAHALHGHPVRAAPFLRPLCRHSSDHRCRISYMDLT